MISVLQYSNLSSWAIKVPDNTAVTQVVERSTFFLDSLVSRVMESVAIEDGTIYTRLTIKNNGGGVSLRMKGGQIERIDGKDIGRKNQFRVHAGQLVVSSIDARNGAVGIVPASAEGSVVTDNFWVFEVKKSLVFPEYLQKVLSRPVVTQQVATLSHGTTNRQYITFDQFLKVVVPVPELSVQREFLKKANRLSKRKDSLLTDIARFNDERNAVIDSYFPEGITSEVSSRKKFYTVDYRNLEKWSAEISHELPYNIQCASVRMRDCIDGFMNQEGVSLRVNPQDKPTDSYRYIGMEAVEKDTGLLVDVPVKVKGADIKSSSVAVPLGFMIYGKLRPYLNKYWVNNSYRKDLICSSEFFAFHPSGRLSDKYLLAILGSNVIQRQITGKMSGARMPRLSTSAFLDLDLPEPDMTIQEEIGEKVTALQEELIKSKKALYRLENKETENLFTSYGL